MIWKPTQGISLALAPWPRVLTAHPAAFPCLLPLLRLGASENAHDSPSQPPLPLEAASKASAAHQERRKTLLSDFQEILSFLDEGRDGKITCVVGRQ